MFSFIKNLKLMPLFWLCISSFSSGENYYSNTDNKNTGNRGERDIGFKVSQYCRSNYGNLMNSGGITAYEKDKFKSFIYNELRQLFYLYTGSLSQDGSGSQWVNDYKDTLFYDLNYNNIRRWEHRWLNNDWSSNVNDLYEYDNNNLISSFIRQIWNTSSWLNNENTLYSFDNFNRLSEKLNRVWISGSWINKNKYVLSYNQNGYQSFQLYQVWQNNNWLDSLNIEYIYNSDNNLSEELTQRYENGSWINESLIVYNYNSQFQVNQSIQKYWQNGEWIDSLRTSYLYNSSGYLVEQTEQLRENSNWVNSSKTIYTYNQYGYTTEAILQTWLFGTWINVFRIYLGYSSPEILDLILLQYWNFVGGWANLYRFILYYEVVSVKDDAVSFDFSLFQNYPNPFNPSTNISWQAPASSWQTLKIYDLLGNEVATLVDEYKPAGRYEYQWNASGLASGVYIYKLQATSIGGQAGDPLASSGQGFVETKKLILIK